MTGRPGKISYRELMPMRPWGESFARDKEIQIDLITGDYIGVIRTRAAKAFAQQNDRTRKHGEVFTPLWICKKMNDYADEVWFGRESVFDTGAEEKVRFTKRKKWTRYVDSRRLEITCGEAPYLISRYDVATREEIPTESRIGILDRKLLIVTENTDNEKDCFSGHTGHWSLHMVMSSRGITC